MKIRSTGIANMNMIARVSKIYPSSDQGSSNLIIQIRVQKPREWEVVARFDSLDIKEILKQALKPSVLWKVFLIIALDRTKEPA